MRFLKTLKWFATALLASLAIYALLAVLLSVIAVKPNYTPQNKPITIFIRSNGVHTDLVLPSKTEFKNWQEVLPPADFKAVDAGFKYIAFGWGHKAFYLETKQWADLKLSTGFNALFFKGETAMHVTYWHYDLDVNDKCKKIEIDEAQYKMLCDYILESFEKDSYSKPILLKDKNYNLYDNFYEANGTYSFINTCNHWANQGLKKSKIKTAVWAPFDKSIFYHF